MKLICSVNGPGVEALVVESQPTGKEKEYTLSARNVWGPDNGKARVQVWVNIPMAMVCHLADELRRLKALGKLDEAAPGNVIVLPSGRPKDKPLPGGCI